MEKSILPPLHVDTEAATTVRAPSAVFTLIVVWVEAFVALPHVWCLELGWLVWLCWGDESGPLSMPSNRVYVV